jgi:hypothetical protein
MWTPGNMFSIINAVNGKQNQNLSNDVERTFFRLVCVCDSPATLYPSVSIPFAISSLVRLPFSSNDTSPPIAFTFTSFNPSFSKYLCMVSAQLAQVMPSTFHCTFSMLRIVLQIYRFIKGGLHKKNIMITSLLSGINFAYGHHLHIGPVAADS